MSFPSAESVWRYENIGEEIKMVIEGEDSSLVIYTQENNISYEVYPKTADGWKPNTILFEKTQFKIIGNPVKCVVALCKTQNSKECFIIIRKYAPYVISDNIGSEFKRIDLIPQDTFIDYISEYFAEESFDYILLGKSINLYSEPFKIITDILKLLNKNGQIDDGELIKLYGINTYKNASQNTYSVNRAQAFFIDYIAKEELEKLLNNKLIKLSQINKNEYILYFNNKNVSSYLLSKGLVLPEKENYKNIYNINETKELIKDFEKNNYVILNLNNKIYHTLDCKFGVEAYNFKLIPQKALNKDVKACKYCHSTKGTYKFYNKNGETTFSSVPSKMSLGDIHIFFLNFKNQKPELYGNNSASNCLVTEINNAKESIDFAIYGINKQPKIFDALIRANARGVKIRWVNDFDKAPEDYYSDTAKLMKVLTSNNNDSPERITYKNAKDKRAIMHNKFFIFDNQKVWTGSANITNTDLSDFNANYALLINSKEIAAQFKNEFEQMYSGKFHNLKNKNDCKTTNLEKNTKLTVAFSPQDKIIQTKILPLVDNAKGYIYIPIFYFTHKDMASHLISAKKRGVDVKIITDSTNAHGKYTIHKELRAHEIKVKTENKAGKMHMKAIIIDDKYSIIGSMNLTKSGEYNNDENTIIIENSNIAKYLKNTFLTMWKSIPDKYLNLDPRAEAPESIGSCSDGIDNDFDGLVDNQDDSCKLLYPKK